MIEKITANNKSWAYRIFIAQTISNCELLKSENIISKDDYKKVYDIMNKARKKCKK